MAEYLHPGRGVVKPSDSLRQCVYSRVLLVYSLTLLYMLSANTGMYVEPSFHGAKMAEYLHPGRGVVKPSDPQRQSEHSRVLLVYSLTLLCMLSANTGMYK